MNLRYLSLALTVLIALGGGASAQDEEALVDEAPAEQAPAKDKSAKKKKVDPPRITDPAVIAVLESKPKTPAEEFEVAKLLAELNQPELARPRLKKLLDAKLDEATLAGLAEKFGTDVFLRLSKDANLNPEAADLATIVLQAGTKLARDPARLEKLVAQLSDPNEEKRQDAILGLQRGGEASVEPLFRALRKSVKQPNHTIRAMLVRLQSLAIEPLRGVLRDGQFLDRELAADLLTEIPARAAVTELVAAEYTPNPEGATSPAFRAAVLMVRDSFPERADANRFLHREAIRQLELAKLIDSQDNYGDAPPSTVRWFWDGDKGRFTTTTLSTASAARADALHAAQAAARMNLEQPPADAAAIERLYLIAQLEYDRRTLPLDAPLSPEKLEAIGKAFDVPAIEQVLSQAMRDGYFAAAAGAAELLGNLGTPAILVGEGGRPTPLAAAARSGDRRLSFAATKAILSLKPDQSFAGASTVTDDLKFLASTSGSKRALVAHPRSGTAQQWAGWLAALGYETDTATNGRDAYALAIGNPDYELAFIHSALDRAQADDLLRQLRADWRTAQLPVALIAMPERTARAERLAEAVPLTHTFSEPLKSEDLQFQTSRLLSMPGCASLPQEIRSQQALWAINTLSDLAENPPQWLDSRAIASAVERTLYVRGMTQPMIALLGNAGTDSSQRELLQIVARESLPLTTRELAALAFARSAARGGVLLTNDEVLHQYDRYNQNAGDNPDTHKVMLIVLTAIDPDLTNQEPSEK